MLVIIFVGADPDSGFDSDLFFESFLMISSSSSSAASATSSSGMYSDDSKLGDRERPEFGVEMLSEEVRRLPEFKIRKPKYLRLFSELRLK